MPVQSPARRAALRVLSSDATSAQTLGGEVVHHAHEAETHYSNADHPRISILSFVLWLSSDSANLMLQAGFAGFRAILPRHSSTFGRWFSGLLSRKTAEVGVLFEFGRTQAAPDKAG
jgi:hypothetical protein